VEREIERELRCSEKTKLSSQYALLVSQDASKCGKVAYESGRRFSKE